jgi:hypothetical protein
VHRGTEHKFEAAVSPANAPQNEVRWSVGGTDMVSLTQNGLLAIPAGVPIGTELTITATTTLPAGAAPRTDSIKVKVTGPEPTSFAINPTNAEMEQGDSMKFTATMDGPAGFDDGIKWSVSPANAGAAITEGGHLTLTENAGGPFTVKAESAGYPALYRTAKVTVTGSGGISLLPPIFPEPGDIDAGPSGQTISLAKDGIQVVFTVANVVAGDSVKWFFEGREIGTDAGGGDNTVVSGAQGETLNLARRIHGDLLGTAEYLLTVEVIRGDDDRPRSLRIVFRVTL